MNKLLCFVFLFLASGVYSQIAPRPAPQKLYNNLSKEFRDFLNSSEAQKLEEKLEQFSNQTSNQICVVIVDDLNGLEAADYATKIINEWGVGKTGKDNGVVILVKPTGGSNGRDLFIATGYGLEGAIPDLAAKRIREEEMYPYLKNGENFTALDKATDKLMQLAKGEIDVKDYTRKYENERGVSWPIIIFIILMIIFSIRRFRGGGGGHTYSRGGRNIFWGGGGFGGGGFGGGSSGGGWGGFGGGRSGGGGSGGKW